MMRISPPLATSFLNITALCRRLGNRLIPDVRRSILPGIAAAGVACFAALPSPARAQGEPQIAISRIDGIRVQGNRTLLALTLDVHNPNGINLPLQSLRFECFFNGVAIARGESTASVDIPANGNASLPVTLDIDAATAMALAPALFPGMPVKYRIEGIAEVGRTGIPVPFSRSGTVAFGG